MSDEAQRHTSWRRALIYSGLLLALAVIANWPQQSGLPVGLFVRMGFPFPFALWTGDELQTFQPLQLIFDLLIWGTAILVPLLTRLVRRRGSD